MSIAPSLCSTVSTKIKRCFRRRAKSSGPKVHGTSSLSDVSSSTAHNDPSEFVSTSRLSPEMEARVQGLPVMWRPKCRKVLEGQTPEMQLVQIVIFESLPDYTKTACSPPALTIITELVHTPKPVVEREPVCSPLASTFITELVHAPKPIVEPELNLDACLNWFQDKAYDDDEEEYEDEEFDDNATLQWYPAEWQQPARHVLPRMDLPHGPRQVAVRSVVVIENALVAPEYKALPSPPSSLPIPPSPSLSPSPLACDVTKPLNRAVRTKRRNGISRELARSALPLPVLLPMQTMKTANRPISNSGQWSSPRRQHFGSKPVRKHTFPMSDFRKLEDVSYDDFAKDLDKRRKTLSGTRALGHLPILVHPSRPTPHASTKTKSKVIGPSRTSTRCRSLKENRPQVEAAPRRIPAIPTTLGVVSPEVEDAEFQWGHLAMSMSISYGTFANGLDERRMSIDDAFVTQDWD